MKALMGVVMTKPLEESEFPLVQLLMEAVGERPPMDPDYLMVIRMAISPAFRDARTLNKWPSAVLDYPVALGPVQVNLAQENWPIESAKRLKRAGIGLSKCDMVYQVDMELRGAMPRLLLPKLYIDDDTDSLFRNLAALERIKGDWETPWACFLKLMDNLIDTEEDVALMREAGVVVHHLGSDAAVAHMWNDLALGLPFYPSEAWATMLWNVNNRTKDWKKQYWVEFSDKYFSRPWCAAALAVATLLVVLSIAQTVLAIFQL